MSKFNFIHSSELIPNEEEHIQEILNKLKEVILEKAGLNFNRNSSIIIDQFGKNKSLYQLISNDYKNIQNVLRDYKWKIEYRKYNDESRPMSYFEITPL